MGVAVGVRLEVEVGVGPPVEVAVAVEVAVGPPVEVAVEVGVGPPVEVAVAVEVVVGDVVGVAVAVVAGGNMLPLLHAAEAMLRTPTSMHKATHAVLVAPHQSRDNLLILMLRTIV